MFLTLEDYFVPKGSLAQLDRVSAFEAEGCRFESPAGAAKSLKGINLYRKLFFDLRRRKIVRLKTKSHLLLVNNIDFRKLTLAYLPR